jgi:hypothetical protein
MDGRRYSVEGSLASDDEGVVQLGGFLVPAPCNFLGTRRRTSEVVKNVSEAICDGGRP